MDNAALLPYVAFRFRLRNPGLFRVATAAGQQFLAGCLETSDWAGVPVGTVVFVRVKSLSGPLIAGRVLQNSIEIGHRRHLDEHAGLLLSLGIAPGQKPIEYLAEQASIITVFLTLEHLDPVRS